ncbi:GntR family transcriptional regulator [Thalassobacillus pellis]|uniref:GntR family transcriptional regulator n=1 Tax=Thalassobacillus pellis TaxID=748008 RepID=UPI0030846D3F|nr:DNA-binding GntR family transcriptional regulator [Thalassobacillus pellis]
MNVSNVIPAQKSVREFAYSTLKEQIMKLELEPGRKISESEITKNLTVSRTPIREAFQRLAQEELLVIYPQRGTEVSKIDLDHVEEARFLRENTERGIVKEACLEFSEEYLFQLEMNLNMQELCDKKQNYSRLYQLDDEFHRILFSGCKKDRIWNLLQQMNSHFNRLRILRLSSGMEWDNIITQHKKIYELILSKDTDKVDEVMEKHLKLVVTEKDVLKEKYPDYFK